MSRMPVVVTLTEPVEAALVSLAAATPAKIALRSRSCWVETVFADLKCNHTLARAWFGGKAFEVQALLAAAAHDIEQSASPGGTGPGARRLLALALVPLTSSR